MSRVTVRELAGRVDEMGDGIAQILNTLAGSDTPATAKAEARAEPARAEQRTVKLPDLTKHTEARRAMGVDGTYKENVAIFKLREDGTPVCKKDGTVRKPTRVRVEDVRYLLAHQEDVESLCDFIESQD
jgi:hypothetical protein